VGSCDGKFYALDKHSGRVAWSHDVRAEGSSGAFKTAPLIRQGLVIAGTANQCSEKGSDYVYAFDRQTGKVHWKQVASADSDAFTVVLGEDPNAPVVFGTREGEWLSINADSGAVIWRYRATSRGMNCESRTSIVSDGVTVCLLAHDGSIHCLDGKSGRELWKQRPDSTITTDVLMYKDVLYFGTADSRITGLNPANGEKLVRLRTPYTPSGGIVESYPDIKDEFLFVYATVGNSSTGAALTLSDEFESVVWSRTSAEHWTSRKPELWKGVLVAGNCQGDLVGYRIRDGEPQWHAHVDGCVDGLAHDDSTLYISVREGAVYAY